MTLRCWVAWCVLRELLGVQGAVPMVSGQHRWHYELLKDSENDETSTMGVCVEVPGPKYQGPGWWVYRCWNGQLYSEGVGKAKNAK
jgi:hypothetical protein